MKSNDNEYHENLLEETRSKHADVVCEMNAELQDAQVNEFLLMDRLIHTA